MLVSAALATVVTLSMAMPSGPARADAAMDEMMKQGKIDMAAGKIEKCYGVNAAGKNDCQTATASCAGSSTKDFDKSAFIILPSGTCGKIAGASMSPS
jgi:uncharacterized membrane protein